jgi:allantoicase
VSTPPGAPAGGHVVATHVRLDVIPDGGLARLRINGEIIPEGLAELRQRWQGAEGARRRLDPRQSGA